MLDLELLRSFVSVVDAGGFTRAGERVHRTQSTVSQQIKRLEEVLGCSLFERDRRGLRLTRSGERLFGKGKRLLGLNDEIWAEMAGNAVAGEVLALVGAHIEPQRGMRARECAE